MPNFSRLLAIAAVAIAVAALPISARAQTTSAAPPPAQPETTTTASGTNTATADDSGSASGRSQRLLLGPDLGVYLPISGKTRDRFGSSWPSIGLGLGPISPGSTHGALGLDLNVLWRSGSDRHVFFAPVGVQWREAISNKGSSIPYIGASADVVFADIRSPQDNVHSGTHLTGGGSLFVGSTLGRRSYAEMRLIAVGSIRGFDLSGLNITAGLRF